jgi:hypothetical protein
MSGWLKKGNMPDDFSAAGAGEAKTGPRNLVVGDEKQHRNSRLERTEPVLDSKGRPTGEYTFQASGANRALELLGKEYGMLVDRSDTTHRYATIDELIEKGTPEEVRAELARLKARKEALAGSKVVN